MLPIVYVLPGAGLTGGVRVVLEHVAGLAAAGFPAEAWHPGPPPAWFPRPVRTRPFDSTNDLLAALRGTTAVKVATWWETAYLVANALRPGDRGFYLVQDIETSYAPDPHTAARVRGSYALGLTPISEGRWVDRQLRGRFGQVPRFVGIGLDHELFSPPTSGLRAPQLLASARTWSGVGPDLKDWTTTRAALAAEAAARPGVRAVTFSVEPDISLPPGVPHTHHRAPDDAAVAELYRTSAAFLMASRHEGFGLPAAEAMASGCPVVATRANGNAEFCRDGETALLADPGDAAGLADRLVRLLDDEPLRERLAANARDAVAGYRWADVIPRLVEALELGQNLTPRPPSLGGKGEPAKPLPASGRGGGGVPSRSPTVLLAGELGGGFGHAAPLLALAEALAARGARPVLALPDLVEVWPVLRGCPFPAVQAPHWHRRPGLDDLPGFAAGYADILAVHGYSDPDHLHPVAAAWDGLFDLVRPALVVCDHAPTACLAAAGAVPAVTVGGGFEVPPADTAAFTRLLGDQPPRADDDALLAVVQEVQRRRNRPVPDALPAAFPGARFATVLPELDPYAAVRPVPAVGPLTPLSGPLPPPAAPRYFAYLNATEPAVRLLHDLARAGLPGTAYLRGAVPQLRDEVRRFGVEVLDAPRPWADVLRESAAVVHHGGVGTAQTALAAGRPQVCLPEHLEHLLTAHLLRERGAGAKLINPAAGAGAAAVRAALADPGPAAALARAVAGRPGGLPRVLDYCCRLLGI